MTEELVFIKFSWDEIHTVCTEVATKLRKVDKIKIFPWDRGGHVVAGIMTHYGCVIVETQDEADVIVDDIADTGTTMATLFTQPAAVLFVRKGCVPMPAYFAREIILKNYILFPWQNEEEERKAIKDSGNYRSTDLNLRRPNG